ncbi:glycosyltransferase family 2 protein [Planctomicrobium sp. SH661]|uniref:glycosyltransferase family 2 protein n=1 Tax=Planctomicrobium sp. SH661 TaxID=3448124 RepID=UPI003F5C52C8
MEQQSPSAVNPPMYSQAWYESMRTLLGEGACRQLGIYALPEGFTLSVVIPVYNERNTLPVLLERVRAVPIPKEIVLIDDCSKDGTREMLKEYAERDWNDPMNRIAVTFHEKNQGKGAAVKTGMGKATGDVVIIQDADLEYDPSEIPRLLQPIVEDRADVVFGSRFLGDQPHRILYFWHYCGNKFLTTLSNCFTNLNLTDMETCYKLFKREVIHKIQPKLQQSRFGIEPEITARVARARCRIFEMSISYNGRTYAEGKKIGVKDGFKALWCIVRYGLFE